MTGTLGQEHCLDFYAKVYNARMEFRIPRNLQPAIYQIEPQFATTEKSWLENIKMAAELYHNGGYSLGISGPVLIVVDTISTAKKVVEEFRIGGHAIMKSVDGKWKSEVNRGKVAHVFPYYRSEHRLMDKLPDASVVIATNKGGRGLDLKLDGKCPDDHCKLDHSSLPSLPPMPDDECPDGCKRVGGRVLFVILTEVLAERQDVQARGRCGRCGKAGVVQYQLLEKRSSAAESLDVRVSRLIEMQSSKGASECNELLAKAIHVGDAVHDNTILEHFVKWGTEYEQAWINTLLCEGSKLRYQGLVQDKLEQWLKATIEERWASWRTMGKPNRAEGDLLWHFRQRCNFRDVVDLASAGAGLKKFAERFKSFAAVLRLDAEQYMSAATALLSVCDLDPSMGYFCEELLRQSADKECAHNLPQGDHGSRSGRATRLYYWRPHARSCRCPTAATTRSWMRCGGPRRLWRR